MVLLLSTYSQYKTFLISPTLLRLLPIAFKPATRTTPLRGRFSSVQDNIPAITSKYYNLCHRSHFTAFSTEQKDWNGVNMPFCSSLRCYLERTPLFICSDLLHFFLLDFVRLCPGLSASGAPYWLIVKIMIFAFFFFGFAFGFSFTSGDWWLEIQSHIKSRSASKSNVVSTPG